jgi:hypothetical protein
VRGEEVEDPEVEIGERRGPRRGTRAGAASGSARRSALGQMTSSRSDMAAVGERRAAPTMTPPPMVAGRARRYGAKALPPARGREAAESPAPRRLRSRQVRSERERDRSTVN